MSNIRNINLLYCPALSVWGAHKKDKAASRQVTKSHGAKEGAANVYKELLPDSAELDAVQKWSGNFRNWVYHKTLPWSDNGWRIGAAVAHMDFMAEAGERINVGMALVDTFLQAYQHEIEKAKQAGDGLGDLFDPADYPTERQLRQKFSFTIEVQVMPLAEDLRIVEGVPPEEVEKLVKVAEADYGKRVADAMHDAYRRLYEVVGKLATTLEQYGDKTVKSFHDTLVDNLRGQLEVLPALNLTGDPQLTALAERASALTLYEPARLRKSEQLRLAAIMQAHELMAQFPAAITGVTLAAPPALVLVPTTVTQLGMIPTEAVSKRALFADML